MLSVLSDKILGLVVLAVAGGLSIWAALTKSKKHGKTEARAEQAEKVAEQAEKANAVDKAVDDMSDSDKRDWLRSQNRRD